LRGRDAIPTGAILVSLAALVLLLLPVAALAWSNGPSGANGFGTHDWVL